MSVTLDVTEQVSSQTEARMTVTEHLEELRSRIFKILGAALLGMAASYFYIDELVAFFTAPAGKLYYLRPAEAFFIYLKVGVVAGLAFTSPLIFYQLWAFVMPAFSPKEKLLLGGVVLASVALFFAGLGFAYTFVLPLGLQFFMGFDSSFVQSMISMESYVDFVLLLLPFGLVFEMPLVLVLGSCLGLLNSGLLCRWRKYVLFGIFVIAAVLTPPDVISQLLLALLMQLLYELSILFIKYILRN